MFMSIGDISFRGRWENQPGQFPFELIAPTFNEADFVLANLESPLVPESYLPVPGKCTLRGAPEWGKILLGCGIKLVSLANNHVMDYGEGGLDSTLRALDEAGIAYIGAGRSANEACSPVIKEISGQKVAFLGRSSVEVSSSCYATTGTAGVALLETHELVTNIKSCKEAADFVVVLLHWGIEHYRYPTTQQRKLARRLNEAGADLILGHHPHVLQGEERVGTGLVSYSSGNFLFDEFPWSFVDSDGQERMTHSTLSSLNRQGVILEITFSKTDPMIRHIFTRLSTDARVVLDESPSRKKDFEKLSARLHWPFYATFWKIYSLKREWDLRLKAQLSPGTVFKKIHKIRPRHFRELARKLRRSCKVAAGKSTNPYEG